MTAILAAARPPDPFDAPGLEIFSPPCLAEWNMFGVQFCVNRAVIYMFLAAAIVIPSAAVFLPKLRLAPRVAIH